MVRKGIGGGDNPGGLQTSQAFHLDVARDIL